MARQDFLQEYADALDCLQSGDSAGAKRAAKSLIALARKTQCESHQGLAQLFDGYCALNGRDADRALAALTGAAPMLKRAGLWAQFGEAKFFLGVIQQQRSQLASSLAHWFEALRELNRNAPGSPILGDLLDTLEPALTDSPPEDHTHTGWCDTVLELSDAYLSLARAQDALRLAERALDAGLQGKQLLRARRAAGTAAAVAGMPDRAINHLREATAIAVRTDGLANTPPDLLHTLGKAYKSSGRYDDAIATLERARKIQESSSDAGGLLAIGILVEIGSVHRDCGRLYEARQYLQKALLITQDLPFREDPQWAVMHASVLTNLGLVETDEFNYEIAVGLQEEAVSVLTSESFSYPPGMAQAEANLALALHKSSRYEEAIAHWRHAVEHYELIGNLGARTKALSFLGEACLLQGNAAEAAQCFDAVLASLRHSSAAYDYGRTLFHLAETHALLRKDDLASREYEEAAEVIASLNVPGDYATVLSQWADFATSRESLVLAESLRLRARELFGQAGVPEAADLEETKRAQLCLALQGDHIASVSMDAMDRLSEIQGHAGYALFVKATVLDALGHKEEAISMLERVLSMLKDDVSDGLLARTLLIRASILSSLNRNRESAASAKRALAVVDREASLSDRAALWLYAGRLFRYDQEDWAAASICLTHASECYKRAGDLTNAGRANRALGFVYADMKKRRESCRHFAAAVKLFADSGCMLEGFECEVELGLAQFNEGDVPNALATLRHVLDTARRTGQSRVAAQALHFLLRAYVHLFEFLVSSGNLATAELVLASIRDEAERRGEEEDSLLLAAALLQLSKAQVHHNECECHLGLSSRELNSVRAILTKRKLPNVIPGDTCTGEERTRFICILREVLLGRDEAESRRTLDDVLSEQAISEDYTRQLWEYGFSRQRGWRNTAVHTLSARATLRGRAGPSGVSTDPELGAIRQLVTTYHQLGVWEDPRASAHKWVI